MYPKYLHAGQLDEMPSLVSVLNDPDIVAFEKEDDCFLDFLHTLSFAVLHLRLRRS